MNKIKFLPAIFFSALMISCGSDDDKETVAPTQTFLVNNETITDMNDGMVLQETEFGYDANNRLVSLMSDTESKTFTWGANGKISKMTSGSGSAMRETIYTYNSNGALTGEQRNHPATSSVEVRYEYTYFADRYEEKQFNSDGEYIYRNAYYYTADKKNIVKIENFYGTGEPIGSKEFLYDNKIGLEKLAPYSQMPEPFYNANNAVTQTNRNTSNVVTYTAEIPFEYDVLGHPTSVTRSGFLKHGFGYLVK